MRVLALPALLLASWYVFADVMQVASPIVIPPITSVAKAFWLLLMDGELTFNRDDLPQPMVYRGFKIVNQEKLRDLRGDILRTWNKNGMLVLIFAHLLSLELVRDIFARQGRIGALPNQTSASSTDGDETAN